MDERLQFVASRRGESEFRPPLIPRNLLILLKARKAKNCEFAQVSYTAGTPRGSFLVPIRKDIESKDGLAKLPWPSFHFLYGQK